MDGWAFFSSYFHLFMFDEGDLIKDILKKDPIFKMIFIFVSVLSFVRNVGHTSIILLSYYFFKLTLSCFFKEKKSIHLDSSLSLDPKQL